jgi:phospholipid transport system substrate-binding protein
MGAILQNKEDGAGSLGPWDSRRDSGLSTRTQGASPEPRGSSPEPLAGPAREPTPAQRKGLVEEFRAMLVRTYSNALEGYQGQEMRVLPSRVKPGDTDATVRNQFTRAGGQPVPIDYQMHKTPEGWKIYDIAVEGISLVLTYRSEFDQVVKQEGVDGLIKRLGQKNEPAKVGK